MHLFNEILPWNLFKFSPKSDWGKIFCIFYGFIGIPICGVFIASTSDYFSNMFLYLYERRKKKEENDKRRSIFIAAILFLIPGLAVFFFIPAAIFSVIEVLLKNHWKKPTLFNLIIILIKGLVLLGRNLFFLFNFNNSRIWRHCRRWDTNVFIF